MQEKKLKGTTVWLMIGVAFFFDILQILLSWILLGWLLIPIEYGVFWIWFKMYGINLFSAKKVKVLGVGALFEAVSGGIIPAFTLVIARVAFVSKIKGNVS